MNPMNPAPPKWTRSDDKAFENALVRYPDGTPNRWHLISLELPGKAPQDVLLHYQALVQDIYAIDSGAVQLPDYDDDDGDYEPRASQMSFGSKSKKDERKRGTPWSEDEHIRFLEGLKTYGKGDWRNISRMAVKTRTATQVASHAQKYFLRQQNGGSSKESKRKSIHDITQHSIPG